MAVLDDFVDDACKLEPPLDHGTVDGSRLVDRLPMKRSTVASGRVRPPGDRQADASAAGGADDPAVRGVTREAAPALGCSDRNVTIVKRTAREVLLARGLDAPEHEPHTRPHAAVPRLAGMVGGKEPGDRACSRDKPNVGLPPYSDRVPAHSRSVSTGPSATPLRRFPPRQNERRHLKLDPTVDRQKGLQFGLGRV
jgi:hypothetical protein